jgi:hypothetical protein
MSAHPNHSKKDGAPRQESAVENRTVFNLSHTGNGSNKIDFDSINAALLADYLSTLKQWLPNGKRTGAEWCVGSLGGEPGDSLKINVQSGVWKDFASGEKGGSDPVSLYAAINNLSQAKAAIQLGGLERAVPHSGTATVCRVQEPVAIALDFRPGNREDLQTVARLRRVEFWAVATMQQNRVLGFGTVCGFPCWIVTDEARKVAEARRMDGLMFPSVGGLSERKAHTLRGSSKAWPVGLMMPNNTTSDFKKVLLVEGSGDLAAAYHFVHRETQDWLPVAMLGAGSKIAQEAISLLKGKHVRVVPHVDKAGTEAAQKWSSQLKAPGISTDWFDLGGLRRFSGEAVKDLNDCTDLYPGDVAELEGLLK